MTTQKIGRYEIQEELGRGGMATVFKAYDPHFERTVAVKVLPREFLHEPEFRARFVREAKTVAALEHPAIVPVYDYGEDDGQPFLVMRLMPGGSLAERIQEGPISTEETATILKRIGSALDQAHRQGVIHRDLKPSNILFDQFGEAYLADFGIVHVSSSTAALTASGSLVGTPAYMSPEQVYGDKALDGRSDIYALGVILFQMLTGGVPFSADTPARMMMKHVMDPVPAIHEKRPDLPSDYDKVITKAMAKDREARFPTATELSTAVTDATRKMKRPDFVPVPPVAPTEVLPPEEAMEVSEADLFSPEPSSPAVAPGGRAKPISPPVADQSGPRIPKWAYAVIPLLVVICIASVAGAAWLMANDRVALFNGSPTAVATAESILGTTATAEPIPGATATVGATPAIDEATGTGEAVGRLATATARAGEALSRTPTAEATDTGVDDADATRENAIAARETLAAQSDSATATALSTAGQDVGFPALFGPVDGALPHQLDGFIESFGSDVELSDFIVQATWVNPYAASAGEWDMGLIFRQGDLDQELRLVILSDQTWNLNSRRGDEDSFIEEGSVAGHLNLGTTGANKVLLIALQERGFFFMNDAFVETLDLSDRTNSGGISVGTGFYSSSERDGAISSFKDFAIWAMDPIFGPRSNRLDHVDDGMIKVRAAEVNVVNFIADTIFRNPYDASTGGWDVGYSFRNAGIGDQFWLIADSDEAWSLIDRTNGDDVFVNDGFLSDFDLGESGQNRLTLIAMGRRGYFFVNGSLVTELDLSSRMNPGEIEVVTAFFVGNEIEGEVTLYEDFTVWPLP
jgi:serine/threonine-protein kinase